MLRHLVVDNIAIIEHTSVEFDTGFNVLTGETGAGKSILIDALNFVLGERSSRDIIRAGCDSCRVQASFDVEVCDELADYLESVGVTDTDELILMRTLTVAGKSSCRINGQLVTLAQQKAVGDWLVDVHGQHEHQSLLVPAKHIGYLDLFCGEVSRHLLECIGAVVARMRAVQAKLNSGFPSAAERERRIDILEYQISEIDKAKLSADEESALMDERRVLANAERIRASLEASCTAVVDADESAVSLVKLAFDSLKEIAYLSADYAAAAESLGDCYYALDDAARGLQSLRNDFDFDPERLEQIELRLDLLSALRRKYGDSIEAVLAFAAKCREELDELVSSADVRAALEKELSELNGEYATLAGELSALRKQNAVVLEKAIVSELAQLGMPNAVFVVKFMESDKPTAKGSDIVEFLLSTNAGEPVKPLAKVASGGEVSRIMLSLKVALSAADSVDTMVFDEIDTGISGRVASITGEKICAIAAEHQVLCITHLPQIAAFADRHYLIEKRDIDGRASTSVRLISDDERVDELARIMGDACASDIAKRFASEMIENGMSIKAHRME